MIRTMGVLKVEPRRESQFFGWIQSSKMTELTVLRRDDAIMQGGRLLQAIQAYKKAKMNMRCRANHPDCLVPNYPNLELLSG